MSKILWVVGVDEAGRGPLAGPVSVAAVAIRAELYHKERALFKGIRDSKKLTERAREECYLRLKEYEQENKIYCAVSLVSSTTIDKGGIVHAIRLGLARSLNKLSIVPSEALVLLDGSLVAPLKWHTQETIIRGDSSVPLISAASILAKVTRDHTMRSVALRYPEYGFDVHKGYGTAGHYKALRSWGLCPLHRKTFCSSLPDIDD